MGAVDQEHDDKLICQVVVLLAVHERKTVGLSLFTVCKIQESIFFILLVSIIIYLEKNL